MQKWQVKQETTEMRDLKQKQHWEEEQEIRNWLELPNDVMTNILKKIGVIDILENAQKVCTTWHQICKDPAMWKVIHMNGFLYPYSMRLAEKMHNICKQAVDRSQGQLVHITIVDFVNYELLQYVADRSSKLRRLELVRSYCGLHRISWTEDFNKFPLLEELNLYKIKISKEAIEAVGRYCPMLTTLKLNHETCTFWHGDSSEESTMIRNTTAIAIGENLIELRHLELIGNNMSNTGLEVILDGCRHLELLDLRQCLYIDLKGDLEKRCLEKIKCLKMLSDSLEGSLDAYGNDCVICDGDEDDDVFF